jgi:hypothetical protein
MNRQFNQSGKWRTMEKTIVNLIKNVDQKDVDGGTVKGGTGSHATTIDLSLRTTNTVDKTWQMEVFMFYDDKVGDPRIPVWFYVRVYCNQKLRTHFSMGNRCSKPATIPNEQEIIEFWAAKNLFAAFRAFSGDDQEKISPDEETRDYYVDYNPPNPPPNQLLEFMDEVNQRCRDKVESIVFTMMPSTTIGPRKAYDDVQREILRKFNRWKNNGQLKSDIPAPDLYPGEPADAWQILDECGGRASPEVDHVEPSYQQGRNSYVNARLVSFYHNHLYREKKTRGSKPLNETLLAMYNQGEIRLSDPSSGDSVKMGGGVAQLNWVGAAVVKRTKSAKDYFNEKFADDKVYKDPNKDPAGVEEPDFGVIERATSDKSVFYNPLMATMRTDRQAFLEADWERKKKQKKEDGLTSKYGTCAGSFKAGFDAFVNDLDHPGRKDLLTRIAGAGIKLCVPSDVLKANEPGIQNLEASPVYAHIDEGTAKGKQAYKDVDKRFKDLKTKLGIA